MSLETINLTGHLLIAMPSLTDSYFKKSVTFICTHNQDGAMGVVINHPTDMTCEILFEKINVTLQNQAVASNPVLSGGPVKPERGFVLHPPANEWDSSFIVSENTALTTSKDILEAIATGHGPEKFLLSLGYAGWVSGQLEQEMAQNAWLSVRPKDAGTLHKVLFATPHEEQYSAAIALLGFDPAMLSDVAGHA